jgi:hypothetical protein
MTISDYQKNGSLGDAQHQEKPNRAFNGAFPVLKTAAHIARARRRFGAVRSPGLSAVQVVHQSEPGARDTKARARQDTIQAREDETEGLVREGRDFEGEWKAK